MIVCDDEVLGHSNVLLGRDFLVELKATLDYMEPPTLYLRGEEVILCDTEENIQDEVEEQEDGEEGKDEVTYKENVVQTLDNQMLWEDWLRHVRNFYQEITVTRGHKSENVDITTISAVELITVPPRMELLCHGLLDKDIGGNMSYVRLGKSQILELTWRAQ